MRPYTIGLTIHINADGTYGLYENGLRQNVIFLYQLFKASPLCKRVFLLNHGEGEPTEGVSALGIDPADVVRTPSVKDQLDYVIGIGSAIEVGLMLYLKNRGCKLIAYKGGNGAILTIEAMISKPPRQDSEIYADTALWDALWVTPQHERTCRSWYELLYRKPIDIVPQIWDERFFGDQPGYKSGERPWRVGVLDSNLTVMKSSHFPMLICEAAYRKAPKAFRAMYITNATHWMGHPQFESFCGALDAVRAGVMTVEPRFITSEFLANHADAVVTHQWENGLNYLYYDVLHGGYPLIHNSEFLKGHGYYFEAFDLEGGADALLLAKACHDERDGRETKAFLASLNPMTPANIDLHEGLLERLAA